MKKILAIITLVILVNRCGKPLVGLNCKTPSYSFNDTIHLTVAQDYYHLGDTISLYSAIPHHLLDKNSNELIDYSMHLGIGGNLNIGEIDSIQHLSYSAQDFFWVSPVSGNYSVTTNKKGVINYEKTLDKSIMSIKIVPQKPGAFFITLTDLYCNGISNANNCSNATFSTYFDIPNGYRNEEIMYNAQIPNVADDDYFWSRSFCFRVVE